MQSKVIFSVILITVSVLVISNFNIIFKEGFKNRVPEILQKDSNLKLSELEDKNKETILKLNTELENQKSE